MFGSCTAEAKSNVELTRLRVRPSLRLGRGGGAVDGVVKEASTGASGVEISGRS